MIKCSDFDQSIIITYTYGGILMKLYNVQHFEKQCPMHKPDQRSRSNLKVIEKCLFGAKVHSSGVLM
jgi:hypothetical protein